MSTTESTPESNTGGYASGTFGEISGHNERHAKLEAAFRQGGFSIMGRFIEPSVEKAGYFGPQPATFRELMRQQHEETMATVHRLQGTPLPETTITAEFSQAS